MTAGGIVFVVGSNVGWPCEVFVLFASEADAARHAEAAYYGFDVFALPVYATYEDCPPAFRLTGPESRDFRKVLADEVAALRHGIPTGTADAAGFRGRTVWAVGSHEEGSPEVTSLFASREPAREHVKRSYYMQRVFSLPVYAKYDDCPPSQRYLEPGPALSQLVTAKWSSPHRGPR